MKQRHSKKERKSLRREGLSSKSLKRFSQKENGDRQWSATKRKTT